MVKCVNVARPASVYNRSRREVVEVPEIKDIHHYLTLFNQGECYKPSGKDEPKRSMKNFINNLFKTLPEEEMLNLSFPAIQYLHDSVAIGKELGCYSTGYVTEKLSYKSEFQIDESNDSNESTDENTKPGPIIRMKTNNEKIRQTIEQEMSLNNESYNKNKFESKSSIIKEKDSYHGQILISHPTALLRQTALKDSVIVLMDIGEYYEGIVINKIGKKKVERLRKDSKFSHKTFQAGGDMPGNYLILHNRPEIEGENLQNIKVSSFDKFKEIEDLIDSKEANEDEFRFIEGIAGWEKRQLYNELDRGIWFHVETDD
eukprot:UN30870